MISSPSSTCSTSYCAAQHVWAASCERGFGADCSLGKHSFRTNDLERDQRHLSCFVASILCLSKDTLGRKEGNFVTMLENLIKFFGKRLQNISKTLSGEDFIPFPAYLTAQGKKEYEHFLLLRHGTNPRTDHFCSRKPGRATTPTERGRGHAEDGEVLPALKHPPSAASIVRSGFILAPS
ncbi:hypothetical protein B0H12DRAFT_1140485, partial [Mycena haematopus]